MTHVSVSVQDLQNRLVSASSDYERLNTEYLEQAKELASTKADMDRSHQALSRYKMHGKFSQKDHRHSFSGHGADSDCNAKQREIELSRDKAEAKVSTLEYEVNQLIDRNTRLLEISSFESSLDKLNSEHLSEMERQDTLLGKYKLQITELQFRLDGQERRLQEVLVAKLENALQIERESCALDGLKQSLRIATEALQTERQLRKQAHEDASRLISERAKLKDSLSTLTIDYQQLQRQEHAQTQEWKEKLAAHQNTIHEHHVKLQIDAIEGKEILRVAKVAMRKTVQELNASVCDLKGKVKEKEKALQATSTSLEETKITLETIARQYDDEHKKLSSCIESITAEFKQSHDNQFTQLRDLKSEYSSLMEEKSRLSSCLKVKERTTEVLDLELMRAEQRVSSLGKQLSQNLNDQRTRIEKERILKLQNHTLEMKLHDCGVKLQALEGHA